ncbi:bifunctional phosphoribosylaminoimidazolecarboxamide formyltransferase/IMP cyclohydrolase [Thermoproteota archaeon]
MLISVYNKRGLVEFVSELQHREIKIISTGGTKAVIEDAGITVKGVEEVTRFPEMLDGRVKTLQPEIFAGLLAKQSEDHLNQLNRFGIKPIDLVVCNFYPFEETISKKDVQFEEVIENIDIGGPSIVRAAAKNHESVGVITNPGQYTTILEELSQNQGCLSYRTRFKLAEIAFGMVTAYDIMIYNGLHKFGKKSEFSDKFFISSTKFEDTKYGENPYQKAAVYKIDGYTGMLDWEQIFGDSKSFNNHLDIGHAYEILDGFDDVAAVVTVKHGNISGFAFAPTTAEAYKLAHACDSQADYGGIIVLNKPVNLAIAQLIGRNAGVDDNSVYTEIVVAPDYDEDALEILKAKQKKKMRLIKVSETSNYPFDLRFIQSALLVQTPVNYKNKLGVNDISFPTKTKPNKETIAKLFAAWEVVRKVQSNGVLIADGNYKDGKLTHFWTLGVGSFRKRNGATKIALDNAGKRAKGAIAASDGFFPFPDSIDLLAEAGIKAVIQPRGSIRDDLVISAANNCNLSIVYSESRAFKH